LASEALTSACAAFTLAVTIGKPLCARRHGWRQVTHSEFVQRELALHVQKRLAYATLIAESRLGCCAIPPHEQ
jgi:hypothetical protein